ncbi:type II toxin-antitoxin system RelE/ParE family toxin [Neorhizobium sp. T786]|nr:type II toxin-antitoxin system RelE/ParE family toxin [Neorhizobium xiangyangii]MCB5205421.1 type II toxin-antitoxin system RelE/ParE family toxin [Neorhizobium xiangyangii]
MSIFKQSATFRKWHMKLKDGRAKAAIAMRLQRLAIGNAGDVAPVGEGVSELRIHYGPGYRVYFQQRGDLIIVLLCGGDKSTQDKDIRTAKEIAAQWSENDG